MRLNYDVLFIMLLHDLWHSTIPAGTQNCHRKPQQTQQVPTLPQHSRGSVGCPHGVLVWTYSCPRLWNLSAHSFVASDNSLISQPYLYFIWVFSTSVLFSLFNCLFYSWDKTQGMDQNEHLLIGQIPGAHKSEECVKTCSDRHSPDQGLGILHWIQNCPTPQRRSEVQPASLLRSWVSACSWLLFGQGASPDLGSLFSHQAASHDHGKAPRQNICFRPYWFLGDKSKISGNSPLTKLSEFPCMYVTITFFHLLCLWK